MATLTPSLVIVGEPYFLSSTTFLPLGPSVTFTASASWFTPRRIACREWSPYTICLPCCLLKFYVRGSKDPLYAFLSSMTASTSSSFMMR